MAYLRQRRVNVSDISKLVEIPPLETITEARDVLLKANEEAQIQEGPRSSRTPAPWGVQVSNFGSFNANVLSILPKIFDLKNFVRDLRTLLRWLNDEASKHDPAFSKWFEGILLNERGIMQYNFEASGVIMRIHSLCFFPFKRFVDDDTVRGIMSLFAAGLLPPPALLAASEPAREVR